MQRNSSMRGGRNGAEPPPVVEDTRVVAYVHISQSMKFSGRSHLFVDGRELGRVPRLAITRSFERPEVLLLHCDHRWNVLGASGGFRTVIDAKKRAERTMARPLREEHERWEDPIVAEVRKAREELFAAAAYDLDEFCKQLRERQQDGGRRVVSLPPRPVPHDETRSAAAKPNKRMQPTRKKRARG